MFTEAVLTKIVINKDEQTLEDVKMFAWQNSKPIISQLRAGGIANFLRTSSIDITRCFAKEMQTVVCIDEGCAHKNYNNTGKLSLAGSGILLPASSEAQRVHIAAKLFVELGIGTITSHEGCGATELAFKRDFPGIGFNNQEINTYAQAWVSKVAAQMIAMQKQVSVDFIAAADMIRPKEFHDAHVIYYDGVGGFNPNRAMQLPKGFVISRKFLPAEYSVQELRAATGIAFGVQGFGNLFTPEFPFTIIVLAKNTQDFSVLQKEVREALELCESISSIAIDGVVVE